MNKFVTVVGVVAAVVVGCEALRYVGTKVRKSVRQHNKTLKTSGKNSKYNKDFRVLLSRLAAYQVVYENMKENAHISVNLRDAETLLNEFAKTKNAKLITKIEHKLTMAQTIMGCVVI